jgi:serine/threonine-protein kinase
VDTAGNVFVTDYIDDRVLKLASGSTIQLPFTGLHSPAGVAVDAAGKVYVVDGFSGSGRVLKLAVGTTSPTELPFTGLRGPDGVAVDSAGNVYVADRDNDRVLKLPAQ